MVGVPNTNNPIPNRDWNTEKNNTTAIVTMKNSESPDNKIT
jgi:hypothetical protein